MTVLHDDTNGLLHAERAFLERGVAVDGAGEGEAQAIWLSILERMLKQAIRQRACAYELYIKRGMALGHALDDWLEAEAELVHGHSTSDSNESERRHEQFRESPDQHRIEPPDRAADEIL